MSNRIVPCWICGSLGGSREHKTKRSDLLSVFGTVNSAQPLFFHDQWAKNRPLHGLNAGFLKSPSLICADCNTTRTQPHDRAWEWFSQYVRGMRPRPLPGSIVRANRIFPQSTHAKMVQIQLYFVKLSGCHILEAGLPVDIASFSAAILTGRPHPNVYLKFGCGPSLAGERMTGMSNLLAVVDNKSGSTAAAAWDYYVDGLAVRVVYAANDFRPDELNGAWHPRIGTGRLLMADFR